MGDIKTFEQLKDFLDLAIRNWRENKKLSAFDPVVCDCYIDCFQCVRISCFGEVLPQEGE